MSAPKSSRPALESRSKRAKPRAKPLERPTASLPEELLRVDATQSGQMLEQLLCVVIDFARGQGISHQQAKKTFERAQLRLGRAPYRVAITPRLRAFRQIAALLEAWYLEAELLDSNGQPKALPITGKASFAMLARHHLPNYDAEHLAEMMITENLLRRCGHGLVSPHRRTAWFNNPNAMMLDRMPALIHGLLDTFAHNTSETGRRTGTRCERDALVALPPELIPAFNETVKAWAQSLLDKADAWARRRRPSQADLRSRRVARVGVEVFAFVEPCNRPSSDRKRQPSA